MVLAALAIVWAVVLGSYVREKSAHRTNDSVSAFKDQLSTLQRTQPGYLPRTAASGVRTTQARRASAAARRRRRDVLFGLVGASVATFLFAAISGSMLWIALNVVCVLAAAAYVALLVNQQKIVTEQRTKVRQIRPVPSAQHSASAAYRRPSQVAVGGQRYR